MEIPKWKSTVAETKNSLEGLSSKFQLAKERINESCFQKFQDEVYYPTLKEQWFRQSLMDESAFVGLQGSIREVSAYLEEKPSKIGSIEDNKWSYFTLPVSPFPQDSTAQCQ